ncbi:MAG: glucose-1-phosphate thymidylyltransferase [Flavobacteriales bacterium]|nr:glucose-1-phosphate thymidylyltransferase [Flavobacteriales bacterium]
MNYILFDSATRIQLLPLVYIRPVSCLRVGIITIKEKWERVAQTAVSFDVPEYLQVKFPTILGEENLLIDGSVFPNAQLNDALKSLTSNQALIKNGKLIGCKIKQEQYDAVINKIKTNDIDGFETIEFDGDIRGVNKLVDVFKENGTEIKNDFSLITAGRESSPIDESNRILGNHVFIEEGADVKCTVLNSLNGPIYVGKDAVIMEGALIKGPFALCNDSIVKMGAKIYGDTTIGPCCKVGGEVTNSVFMGYANKGHEGYLGNSVIGEWCNLGADTNISNLKNTYGEVKYWNYGEKKLVDSGEIFMGIMMGDYSKCAIGSKFNSGTVIGVNANIAQNGFSDKTISSFTWLTPNGKSKYEFNKAVEVAKAVALRRKVKIDTADVEILKHIFELSGEEFKA